MDTADLRERLRHVVWIGGSTCAGKTTSADIVAERRGWAVYHFDRREPFHIYRSVPERQPHLIAFMARTMEQRWVLRSPEEMAEDTIASWGQERFPMVIDDLLAMPDTQPIVAEGPGFFPAQVAPLLSHPRQAIWLVATPAFIEQVRRTRPGSALHTSDPERATRNIIARDVLMTNHVRRQAQDLGLPVLGVDAVTVETLPDAVEAYLSPALAAIARELRHE